MVHLILSEREKRESRASLLGGQKKNIYFLIGQAIKKGGGSGGKEPAIKEK